MASRLGHAQILAQKNFFGGPETFMGIGCSEIGVADSEKRTPDAKFRPFSDFLSQCLKASLSFRWVNSAPLSKLPFDGCRGSGATSTVEELCTDRISGMDLKNDEKKVGIWPRECVFRNQRPRFGKENFL